MHPLLLPSSLTLSLLVLGLAVSVSASSSPLSPPTSSTPDYTPNDPYAPYLAYPASPQHHTAFLASPPPSSSSSAAADPLHPLVDRLARRRPDPNRATNPVARRTAPDWAWGRHPLYNPSSGAAEAQEKRFRSAQFAKDEEHVEPEREKREESEGLRDRAREMRKRGLAWEKMRPGRLDKRDVVSSVAVDFPPSAWIDINDLSTIALLAQAAVARMQTWYEDGVFEWTGWWQTPVLGMAYTNLDLALGNGVNELLIKDLLIRNDDLGWMIDKYIDDQSWWAMFALRAHQAYPNATWLDMVETINNNNTLYWDNTCGGGVLWLTYRPLIKNTITNGLYFSILTRLYRYTGNSTHFDYSMNTLNWWLQWAFDASSGRVADTITADWAGQSRSECSVTGEQTWTYNSGAFLFGLADLYYATGDEAVLDLGRTIAYAAMRDYVPDEETGVLVEGCEDDPPPAEGKPPACQQDETLVRFPSPLPPAPSPLTLSPPLPFPAPTPVPRRRCAQFKGILMLGLSELYIARPDPNIYSFINTQLLSNVFNNVDDSWLFGMWWGGPWNETTAGPKTQINTLCVLAAAATVNADYLSRVAPSNASLGRTVHTDKIAVPDSTATGVAGSTDRTGATGGAGRGAPEAWAAVLVAGVLGAGAVLWV
ncbi:hypothetical protein JCM10207_007047 [Rhodosporidiobolus poonsookiae]